MSTDAPDMTTPPATPGEYEAYKRGREIERRLACVAHTPSPAPTDRDEYVGGHPEMPLHPFEDSGTGTCLACERHGTAAGAALASALMAANFGGDSGEDVDRLIGELAKRGYRLIAPAPDALCLDDQWDSRYVCVKSEGHPMTGPGLSDHDYHSKSMPRPCPCPITYYNLDPKCDECGHPLHGSPCPGRSMPAALVGATETEPKETT